ncbi:5646_t:CDS:1, partial [Racocetra persica]
TILDLTNENTKLETEKASLETQLQELQKNKGLDEEVKKLKAQVAQLEPYKQELLKIKRVQTNQELTIFFQAMEISNSLIGKRFKSDEVWKKTYGTNFDYEDIVDEKLTLENRENMKMAFKVVACICATEKAEELKAQLKKIDAKLKKRIDNINEN